jgi:hypothetical protein
VDGTSPAELLAKAESSKGQERAKAQDRTAELVLKIWDSRRNFPHRADPLSIYPKAAEVLAAIHPTTERFSIWKQPNRLSLPSLSLNIFDLASRVALLGLLDVIPKEEKQPPLSVKSMLSKPEAAYLDAIRGVHDLLSNSFAEQIMGRCRMIRL